MMTQNNKCINDDTNDLNYFSKDVKDHLKTVFDHFKDLKNDKVNIYELH